MKVLITGAGALLGQGIIRALRASQMEATIIAADPDPMAAGLFWADRAHLIPLAETPEYIQGLENILLIEEPDAILLGTEVELDVLAPHRRRLETLYGTKMLISSPEVVRIAGDKWLTYRFLREMNLGCPLSCLPGDEEGLIEEVGFPLVVKPRHGYRSYGVVRVEDRQSLKEELERRPDLIVQQCISTPDEEFTAGALVFDGRCEASIVMRRHLRDGNTYRAFVGAFPELNAGVRRIAEALGAYGPVNVQFRLDGDQIKVFEINARFSGTTPLRVCAGFNEVEMALRYMLDGEEIRQPMVRPMTILRHWSETVIAPERELTASPESMAGLESPTMPAP